MDDITKRIREKDAEDVLPPAPLNQVKTVDPQDTNPRIEAAEKAGGSADVTTPWTNTHQSQNGAKPSWFAESHGSQGWQAQTVKRGDTDGPKQRQNPYSGLNDQNDNEIIHSY